MKKKKKRLVINFPLRALEVAPTRVADPDSIEEIERRLANRPTKGKFASLFQWQVGSTRLDSGPPRSIRMADIPVPRCY